MILNQPELIRQLIKQLKCFCFVLLNSTICLYIQPQTILKFVNRITTGDPNLHPASFKLILFTGKLTLQGGTGS